MSRACSFLLGLAALLASLAAVHGEEAKTPRTDLYGDPLPPGAVARLGTLRLRHAGADVVFSKDGKRAISCSRTGEIRTWDVASGKLVRRQPLAGKPPEHKRFTAVELSPGGTIAAAWNGKGATVYLYDTATGKEQGRIPSIDITLPYLLMRFSSGDKFLALQTQDSDRAYTTQIWDAVALKQYQTLATPPEVRLSSAAFTSDGKRLAGIAQIRDGRERYGDRHYALFLWDTVTGKLLGKKSELRRIDADYLTFSPDGKTLAVGGFDEAVVRLLAADTLVEKARLTAPAAVAADFIDLPVFSPDGRCLAASWGERRHVGEGGSFRIPRGVFLWDLSVTKEPRRISARSDIPIVFAPDGKTFVCRHGGEIGFYDAATGRSLHHQPGHNQVDLALAVSPDGKVVASGDRDGVLRLWDAATSKELWKDEGRDLFITDCFFSADGKRIVTGNTGGSFVFQAWETTKGKALGRITQGENKEENVFLHAATISADGKRFLGVYTKEENTTVPVNPPSVQRGVWDLASGNRLNQRPYRLKRRTDLNGTDGEAQPVFSPDGELLTVGVGDRLAITEVATGCLLAKLPNEVRIPLVLSPDARLLAAMIRPAKDTDPDFEGVEVRSLIETASGEEIVRLELHAPNQIAFTPEGRGLIVSDHKNLCVWDTVTGEKLYQMAWPDNIARTKHAGGYPYVPTLAALPGSRAAASMAEGDILIWDLKASTWPGRQRKRELGRDELESLWSDLAGDARKAYRAIAELTTAPAQTVAFFQDNLRPTTEDKRIAKLLADLDSDSVPTREAAMRELRRLYHRAAPILRQVLESKPSLEMRRRIETIFAEPKWAPPQSLRTLRAIAVLERIGTPEARRLLEKLADGAAARETREAQAALQRLQRR